MKQLPLISSNFVELLDFRTYNMSRHIRCRPRGLDVHLQQYLQCVPLPPPTQIAIITTAMMQPLSIFDHRVLYRCKILSNTMEQRKASIAQKNEPTLFLHSISQSAAASASSSSHRQSLALLTTCAVGHAHASCLRSVHFFVAASQRGLGFSNSNMPSNPAAASVVTVSWRSAISCFVQFPFQFAFLCQPANVRL